MKVLITGSNGFIAQNLGIRLKELEHFEVINFSKQTPEQDLGKLVTDIDAVVHLAGVNRPPSPEEFIAGNTGLTETLSEALLSSSRAIPVIFSSSTQATLDNAYGNSKLAAELALRNYATQSGAAIYIYRLPNVFGKWCKPNYNSAVATFCHNISKDLPIQINDKNAPLSLVYVDDVVDEFISILKALGSKDASEITQEFYTIPVQYQTTVGQLAEQLESFKHSRNTLITEPVGTGLTRALYSTYVSYLLPDDFAYQVPKFGDPRGVFVEMLKTKDSGQFSYFTAHPGITRGGHYHHSKTEKFLVIKGQARFGFRHILTDETFSLLTSGDLPTIVETIPGWTHDITNVGDDEMIVMLWANEIFDRDRPDTIASKV
ncbi:MAG: NAD-dependent epimerase/dehydratase family protein [Methylococcales bacterium]